MAEQLNSIIPNVMEKLPEFLTSIKETFIMVGWSGIISFILGLLLGVTITVTKPGNIMSNPVVYHAIDKVVNFFRSIPFIILLAGLVPLTRLIMGTAIGVEGTLAIITKCVLKLIPKPEESLSVLVSFNSLREGIESVREVIKANVNPTAVEFIERDVVKLGEDFLGYEFPEADASAYVLLTFDGSAKEIEAHLDKLKEVAASGGARRVMELRDPEQAAQIWKVRGALVTAVEEVSEQEPLDIVVPINKIDTFVTFVNELSKARGMGMVSFGHAGDGNVHICLVRGERSEEEWERELDENLDTLYHKAYELGGVTSGEHGIGVSKRKYFFRETNGGSVQLMNRLKKAFDDRNILNRGISYVKEQA